MAAGKDCVLGTVPNQILVIIGRGGKTDIEHEQQTGLGMSIVVFKVSLLAASWPRTWHC